MREIWERFNVKKVTNFVSHEERKKENSKTTQRKIESGKCNLSGPFTLTKSLEVQASVILLTILGSNTLKIRDEETERGRKRMRLYQLTFSTISGLT